MDNLDVLLEISEVMRMGIYPNGKSGVEAVDTLQLVYYGRQDVVFFKHESFLYALNKQLPVFTNSRPHDLLIGKRYVVALAGEQKAFILSKHVDAGMHDQFEQIVNQYSRLLFANDGTEPEWIGDTVYAPGAVADSIHKSNFFSKDVKIEKLGQEVAKVESPKKEESPTKGDNQFDISKKIGGFLSVGGEMLMNGIGIAGQYLGKGIRMSSL